MAGLGFRALAWALTVVLIASVIAAVALVPSAPQLPKGSLTVAASGPGTSTYYVAATLAGYLRSKGIDAGLVIADTDADALKQALNASGVAVVRADIAYYAYEGARPFGKPHRDLRGIATLTPALDQYVQIIVRADSGIKSLKDLTGKRVAVGPEGTVTSETVEKLLRALGLWDKIVKVRVGYFEALYELKLGRIDAVVVIDAAPSPLIYELATIVPIRLVPIPGEEFTAIRKSGLVYLKPAIIGKGTYPGVGEDVETVAIDTVIVAPASLGRDTVRAIIDYVLSGSIKVDKSKVYVMTVPIPLHEEAYTYYHEKGLK